MKWFRPELKIKNRQKETLLFQKRILAATVIFILLSITLVMRLIYLQVVRHQYYTTMSKNNYITIQPIPPARGLIFDRNNVLLAKNIPVFSLVVQPSKVKNLDQEIDALRHIIKIGDGEIESFNRQLNQHRVFEKIPLKIKLTEKQVAKFSVNAFKFPGFSIQANLIRTYPFNSNFAHVLGYVGRINQRELNQLNPENYEGTNTMGKTGIEEYYEPELHGTVGHQYVEIDATGKILRTLRTTQPTAGNTLYLTLDSKLQLAAKQALKGHAGSVVALDPRNGQVLAMVSQPSFDPNDFVVGISQKKYAALVQNPEKPLYNRLIRGIYSIGSTIKPFLALQGLDRGVITPEYKIFDPGWYVIPGTKHVFHDWDTKGLGWVNLHKAIVESCDPYFYNLGYKLGIKALDDILSQFGFGQITHIDLPDELAGVLPTPEYKMQVIGHPWYTGDTVNLSIGQGYMQVTLMQLAVAAEMLATKGTAFKPTLLYAIQSGSNKPVVTQPEILHTVTLQHPDSWNIIANAMHDVTTQGTGYRLGKLPVSVAAKTGTAQVVSQDFDEHAKNIPTNRLSNSLIMLYAPIKNPTIVLVILVEHSPGAAVDAARKILHEYFQMNTDHSGTPE